MIIANKVTVSRSGRKLIDDISIELKPGNFTVVIGPNGAGKSTLMKVLSGEMQPDSGLVSYYGTSVDLCQPADLAKRRAVLPQATQLAFPFTALEIARMGAVAHGALNPGEEARKALSRVGLRGFESRPYPSMSGGEQQRVQFARALAQVPQAVVDDVPRALFLDEPTASLDLGHQISVLETARDFASAGGMVLAILHDLNLAAEFADHLVVLHHGRVVAEGACRETVNDDIIASVYGIAGAVGRVPAAHIPYVLPQSRNR
ncbi:hemin import ATP-binding protein HmuV [Rhizobium wenxiniae]|uniref:Iron complex transport system ATP-binding protein n=1 Tax=Rhizobium wenxiniae TaxID=1737357 RepID=A0A7X0CYH7_9HYPH|nr:heme ABC transporter ATP-binding protein [Rhizobium wenxiniae]MBB6161320.1 iron complex transport system ATP-binding protein [Rhizobium wenxiniae]GGF87994.1 hemin import ATP-binding protein HmuV [Rhizobium wenxiniae]